MGFRPIEFLDEMKKYTPDIKENIPNSYHAYLELNHSVFQDGNLTRKSKELIALAISLTTKCPYCIAYHTKQALMLGITKEEMLEAASVAIEMGGSPAVTYTTMMLRAIEEYQNQKEDK